LSLIVPGENIQVNMVGRLFGQITVSTFFYRLELDTGTAEGTDPDAVAEDWKNSMGASVIDVMSAEWEALTVEVRDPRVPPSWASGEVTSDLVGIISGACNPPSVAMVITRRTATAGRSYRGRIFLPAVPVSYHEDGELTGPALLALQAVADDLLTPITMTGPSVGLILRPIVWSKKLQTGADMTGATARLILRSQRRREIGVGK